MKKAKQPLCAITFADRGRWLRRELSCDEGQI